MLSIEHLCVEYYRRGKTIPAVQDISLAIPPGETVGLVGESGSGKYSGARRPEADPSSGRAHHRGKDRFSGRRSFDSFERTPASVRGKRIAMIFRIRLHR